MKKALIDMQASVRYIVRWVEGTNPLAIYETYPNSARICEVVDTSFEVNPALIWVDCADDVVQDAYYYDTETQTIKPVENAPMPELEQPDMEDIDSV